MRTTAGFTAFAGGLGIVAALVGLLALFWDSLNWIVTLVLDGLAALCFLAGGIVGIPKQFGGLEFVYAVLNKFLRLSLRT